ncbi:MAG: MobA/MobL family protein [Clostridiales bacterium]|nr:MobA/MobL family protein [Clostridiales bacterium]
MAIYHCSIKIISRAGGRSAVASAAYRSGEKLYNDETGITHDFTRKGGVILCEIMLPENAPERYSNREVLWNEVQQIEKRSDAQFAREIEVALPAEMSREEQIECVRSFIRDNFVSEGMIADWALHDKGDGNPHAHIMLTLRGFDEHEKWLQKQKTVFANSRDEHGRPVYDPSLPSYDPKNREETSQYRIPQLDENGNQKTRVRQGKGTEYLWEKISIPANDWNAHSKAELWRSSWAEHCNRYLKPEEQIDHRSYARQGIDKEPTIHEGIVARQMEVEGNVADRCQINREIKERNSIREQIRKIAEEITKLITEKARSIYERYKELRRNLGDPEGSGRDADDLGTAAGGDRFLARAAGRITAIKRAADETEQEIARTDSRIAELKKKIRDKEESISERFRKLKDRRASYHDGADAGPAGSGDNGALQSTRGDIDSFLRELKTNERASEEKRDDSISERKDRELKQKRPATPKERGYDGRSVETPKRIRGQGLSL